MSRRFNRRYQYQRPLYFHEENDVSNIKELINTYGTVDEPCEVTFQVTETDLPLLYITCLEGYGKNLHLTCTLPNGTTRSWNHEDLQFVENGGVVRNPPVGKYILTVTKEYEISFKSYRLFVHHLSYTTPLPPPILVMTSFESMSIETDLCAIDIAQVLVNYYYRLHGESEWKHNDYYIFEKLPLDELYDFAYYFTASGKRSVLSDIKTTRLADAIEVRLSLEDHHQNQSKFAFVIDTTLSESNNMNFLVQIKEVHATDWKEIDASTVDGKVITIARPIQAGKDFHARLFVYLDNRYQLLFESKNPICIPRFFPCELVGMNDGLLEYTSKPIDVSSSETETIVLVFYYNGNLIRKRLHTLYTEDYNGWMDETVTVHDTPGKFYNLHENLYFTYQGCNEVGTIKGNNLIVDGKEYKSSKSVVVAGKEILRRAFFDVVFE
jgi:hypothetical protein